MQLLDVPRAREVRALGNGDARAFQCRAELGVHQAVEAELVHPAAGVHLRTRFAADLRHDVQQPADSAVLGRRLRRHGAVPRRLLLQAQQLRHHVTALELRLCRLGEIPVPEVNRLDPLPEGQIGRHLAKVLLHLLLNGLAGQLGRMVMVGGHRAHHLLGGPVRQAHHRQFLYIGRPAIQVLHLVWVNVLAVGVDDHLFGPPHQVQIAVFVEAANVAGVEPAVPDGGGGGLLVLPVTGHDVAPARHHLAHARVIGLVDLHLDSGQGLSHGTGQGLALG